MAQGTIKKLISNKGFGFIEGESGEVFFHSSAVEGCSFEELREGQSVEYTESSRKKIASFARRTRLRRLAIESVEESRGSGPARRDWRHSSGIS